MPTDPTVDTVRIFLNAIQSGLVVSGNAYITATRVVNSGDALSSFRVSGPNDFIGVRLQRNSTQPYTGNFYTQVTDTVTCEVYHHTDTLNSSGVTDSGSSIAIVQQRLQDLKLTVSGYAWSGVPPPKYMYESHPLAQAQFARADVSYRMRYLL